MFRTQVPFAYKGDKLLRYVKQNPSGSRMDVKAKGIWEDGRWTIELSRKLKTHNGDDVQFEITGSYQFGVSRYEVAGRDSNPELTQPLYGCGDVSEDLTLTFSQ